MENMINTIKKYCYISAPLLVSLLFLILNHYSKLDNIKMSESDLGTLIGIIGTLIGFLLTAITIFISLPKDSLVMKRVKKYNHHKIFANCIISGIIFSCITILIWILKTNYIFILLFFSFSIVETVMAAYYIYILCLYSFE